MKQVVLSDSLSSPEPSRLWLQAPARVLLSQVAALAPGVPEPAVTA